MVEQRKLTSRQLILLADLADCEQWLFNKRTAGTLIDMGLADYRGSYLHITREGRAALNQEDSNAGR